MSNQTTNPLAERRVDPENALDRPIVPNRGDVIASAYIPPAPGELESHLVVVFNPGEIIDDFRYIQPDDARFAVCRVLYDDEEQETRVVDEIPGITYAEALQQFARQLAAATGA